MEKYSQDYCIEIIGEALNVKGPRTKNGKGGYDARRCPVCGGSDCLSIDPCESGIPLVICRSTGCSTSEIIKAIRSEGLPFPSINFRHEAKRHQAENAVPSDAPAARASAAERAVQLLSQASILDETTPYIEAKGFGGSILSTLAHVSTVRRNGDRLLIPLYNHQCEVTTIQTIYPDGKKILLKDGLKKGSFHPIGIGVDEISSLDTTVMCLAEGWATAVAIHLSTELPTVMAVDKGNLKPVALALRCLLPSVDFIFCADDDAVPGKPQNPGIEAAKAAAHEVGGKVAYPRDGLVDKTGKIDFWDVWHTAGPEAVKRAVDAASIPPSAPEPEKITNNGDTSSTAEELTYEIDKLSALTALEYELSRQAIAKRFCIPPSRLDKLVSERKANKASIVVQHQQQKPDLLFEKTEPWPERVEGAALLDEMEATIGRYIACEPSVRTAATLWAAYTWFIDVVNVAPIALITAPEKSCGKTQLLAILARLSARALPTSGISPAALFRTVEQWQPSLFIDEADTFIRDNDELRGVINSGHTRDTAYVIRTVGDDYMPKRFLTWGAKAIAGIKVERIAPTITDRSIVLSMRKRLKSETVERLRKSDPGLFSTLRSKLARFALDAHNAVAQAIIPELEELTDRQMDNWEPLFAVAVAAGGAWPEKAKNAALMLSVTDDEPTGVGPELLANIQEIFEDCKNNPFVADDRISTTDLISALCEREDWRWSKFQKGKPIDARGVSSLLKSYGIKTNKTVNFGGDKRLKGYLLADFQDAFFRYLPAGDAGASTVSTHIV